MSLLPEDVILERNVCLLIVLRMWFADLVLTAFSLWKSSVADVSVWRTKGSWWGQICYNKASKCASRGLKTPESKTSCFRTDVFRKGMQRMSSLQMFFNQYEANSRCSQNCEQQLLASCPSILLSAWNNSAPTGRILITFDIWAFFENL